MAEIQNPSRPIMITDLERFQLIANDPSVLDRLSPEDRIAINESLNVIKEHGGIVAASHAVKSPRNPFNIFVPGESADISTLNRMAVKNIGTSTKKIASWLNEKEPQFQWYESGDSVLAYDPKTEKIYPLDASVGWENVLSKETLLDLADVVPDFAKGAVTQAAAGIGGILGTAFAPVAAAIKGGEFAYDLMGPENPVAQTAATVAGAGAGAVTGGLAPYAGTLAGASYAAGESEALMEKLSQAFGKTLGLVDEGDPLNDERVKSARTVGRIAGPLSFVASPQTVQKLSKLPGIGGRLKSLANKELEYLQKVDDAAGMTPNEFFAPLSETIRGVGEKAAEKVGNVVRARQAVTSGTTPDLIRAGEQNMREQMPAFTPGNLLNPDSWKIGYASEKSPVKSFNVGSDIEFTEAGKSFGKELVNKAMTAKKGAVKKSGEVEDTLVAEGAKVDTTELLKIVDDKIDRLEKAMASSEMPDEFIYPYQAMVDIRKRFTNPGSEQDIFEKTLAGPVFPEGYAETNPKISSAWYQKKMQGDVPKTAAPFVDVRSFRTNLRNKTEEQLAAIYGPERARGHVEYLNNLEDTLYDELSTELGNQHPRKAASDKVLRAAQDLVNTTNRFAKVDKRVKTTIDPQVIFSSINDPNKLAEIIATYRKAMTAAGASEKEILQEVTNMQNKVVELKLGEALRKGRTLGKEGATGTFFANDLSSKFKDQLAKNVRWGRAGEYLDSYQMSPTKIGTRLLRDTMLAPKEQEENFNVVDDAAKRNLWKQLNGDN